MLSQHHMELMLLGVKIPSTRTQTLINHWCHFDTRW